MTDTPIRVMLVDDQELIRTGFRLVLLGEPGIDVIAEASDGAAALAQLERLAAEGASCDIVLMDVRMPGMNGIDATREIAERFPAVKVVVLTTFDLDEYATGAIQAGASGFLLKDARPTELVDAIRRVAAGDATMAPSVTKRLLEQLRATGGLPAQDDAQPGVPGAAAGAGVAPELAVLTERELDVLRLIAEGKNNGEISAELFLSESTVKTHVGRVLSKLQLRDRVHAVIFAKQHGL
ncbi:response regulator [Leucobacter luti]|uniref:LuxR family two component transcriptional regulator n=1 Tax=Leucobacter luti TaxID=340320 RepID=A0A4Q7TXB2_9MICO|nr:response regulator transcription factor [Leucobacter luti]MBL3698156.1 DNA-binding response regulator [Leucobacter luti]RZT64760.1 LuxR family two component transcriptional regulator [Leucobacter luti]